MICCYDLIACGMRNAGIILIWFQYVSIMILILVRLVILNDFDVGKKSVISVFLAGFTSSFEPVLPNLCFFTIPFWLLQPLWSIVAGSAISSCLSRSTFNTTHCFGKHSEFGRC